MDSVVDIQTIKQKGCNNDFNKNDKDASSQVSLLTLAQVAL